MESRQESDVYSFPIKIHANYSVHPNARLCAAVYNLP
jgi:hypothetical protein